MATVFSWEMELLWSKNKHSNKSACSKLNPEQSCRSKLRTCLRNGRLLRSQLNSTTTSDGSEQKPESNVWHYSQSLHDWTSFDRIFFSFFKFSFFTLSNEPSLIFRSMKLVQNTCKDLSTPIYVKCNHRCRSILSSQ